LSKVKNAELTLVALLLLMIIFDLDLKIIDDLYGKPLKFLTLSLKYLTGIFKYLQTI
jgi:hypothetical protein